MSTESKADVKRERILAQYAKWEQEGLFDEAQWDGQVLLEALETILTRNYGRIESGEVRRVRPQDLHWWCEAGVARDPKGVFKTKEKKPGVFVLEPKNVTITKRTKTDG